MIEIVRHGMAARDSNVAVFNGVVQLAGVVLERGSDIRSQMLDVSLQVDALLAACGIDKIRILRAHIIFGPKVSL